MSFYTKELSELGFKKSQLYNLLKPAHEAGLLSKEVSWGQVQIFIDGLPNIKAVQNQIDNYTRELEIRQANKAA